MLFKRLALLANILIFNALAQSISLENAVDIFVKNNHDIQIFRKEALKTRADLITANEHPNPTLQTSYEFLDINHRLSDTARGSNAQATVILSHPFETAGKLKKRVDLATKNISLSDFNLEDSIRRQLLILLDAYYTVLLDQTNLSNAEENSIAYSKIVDIAKAKLEHGFLSQLDYQKILLQRIDYTREIENNKLVLVQDKETLALLLALPDTNFEIEYRPDSFLLPSIKTLYANVLNRPDCKAAKKNQEVANSVLVLEKANAVPNLSVGFEYASFGPSYEPLAGVNFGIAIPIYDRNEGDIERARIGTLQSINIYDKVVRTAQSEIAQSYQEVLSTQKVYDQMTEGFLAAKDLKDKQEKIFALKGMSILEFLDGQKSYREFQKSLNESQFNLYMAIGHLKLNSGLDLVSPKGQ